MSILLEANTILDQLKELTPTPTGSADALDDIVGGANKGPGFSQMVGLVLMLIIILVAAYLTSRFVGKIKLGQLKKTNFQVIDTYRISGNKLLQIVKVGNKYVVIGIGKDTVNFITELTEDEVVIREFGQSEKQSFKQIMDRLKKKEAGNDENT